MGRRVERRAGEKPSTSTSAAWGIKIESDPTEPEYFTTVWG
ncbi:MAG: hypothetical protein V8S72_01160 [Oscillospiraceae bacterium]